jgi:hypothetical protein
MTMTRQTFMSLAAAVSVVTGLAALLAPAQLAAFFGVTLDDLGNLLTRLLGSAYLGYAAICWFAKDVRDDAARRAIALGNLVSWALALVLTIAGVVIVPAGTQSLLLVALEGAFASAWGYFAFIERAEVAATRSP